MSTVAAAAAASSNADSSSTASGSQPSTAPPHPTVLPPLPTDASLSSSSSSASNLVYNSKSENLSGTRDSVSDIWGPRMGYHGIGQWPVRVDAMQSDDPDQWFPSACVLCSNGCGCDIGTKEGKIVAIRGRANDRINRGRLGPKGLHCIQVNHNKERLTTPLMRKNGKLEPCSWDEAMTLLVDRSKDIIRRRTSHAIAFYTSGQLFLEDYHALAMIGKAGFHSLNMDGNTRLCTATAAAAMRESFGSDGQPGSYEDLDIADCIFLVGHNMSHTQTVLWSRILDRLAGPNPPRIIVMDPRVTDTAKHATIHLANRAGTNLALLNGILHVIIRHGKYAKKFVEDHTLCFDNLEAVVKDYPPQRVAEMTGVPAESIIDAASMMATSKHLVSTVLQGVFQSNQGTASACAVNNLHLLLGQIGKPGSGLMQFNGQPTAQNNREAGCNGEFPGFRNFQNTNHMQSLADAWDVSREELPHWNVPTHIMQMLEYVKTGLIEMMWVSGTNPLVSLPSLETVRALFTKPELFLVVQDIFLNETAEIADLVLPAAMWGEKTGCFTNVDRTVHLSCKAIDPPGLARSDLNIWIEYSRRMNMKNKSGGWLLDFNSPEEAFEHFKRSTKNRPCDYTGLSYSKLYGRAIQWPCNEEHPEGTPRLYWDGKFPTGLEECESYGHDLDTGAPLTRDQYASVIGENGSGKALFKVAHYHASMDQPSKEYPYQVITGRHAMHFHTRTKTGRMTELQADQPEAWLEINPEEAEKHGIKEGDMVTLKSAHGQVELPARFGKLAPNHLFIPFHFGYFDRNLPNGTPLKHSKHRAQAANELTTFLWDPVSKQPLLKSAAVCISRVEPSSAPRVTIHEKQTQTVAQVGQKKANVQALPVTPEEAAKQEQYLPHLMHRTYHYLLQTQSLLLRMREKHSARAELAVELMTIRHLVDVVMEAVYSWKQRYPLIPSADLRSSRVRSLREARLLDRQPALLTVHPVGGDASVASVEEQKEVLVMAHTGVRPGAPPNDHAIDVTGLLTGAGELGNPASSTDDIDKEFNLLFPPERPGPTGYNTILEFINLHGVFNKQLAMVHALILAAQALRDPNLMKAMQQAGVTIERCASWTMTQIKAAAPQTLCTPM